VDAAALAPVLERLTVDSAGRLLQDLDASSAASLLARIDPGRTAALMGPLETADIEQILGHLPAALAREISDLMTYPADTAGSLMDVRVTTVRHDASAGQALERVRASQTRGIDVVAVDADGVLAGTLAIDELALASPDRAVRDLIHRTPASVQALAPREDVVDQLSRLKLASLPVVDAEQRVVGVIRYDALLRAAEEEVSADMQTMVGASAAERALSPVGFAVSKRLPWLQINLVTAFLAAAVVGLFEETIARFTALAILLPVVAGQSGNTGAQALAVTMRGLVLREIRLRHWSRVLSKEAIVALVNGVGVAATTALAVYVWSRSTGLSIVIALSMVVSMVCAGLAGAAVPMCLVAARQDPAQSSSIILTTVTDVVGFMSVLGIATLLAGSL
jgi:magnesium transporter